MIVSRRDIGFGGPVVCKYMSRIVWRAKGLDTYLKWQYVFTRRIPFFIGVFCGAEEWGRLSFYCLYSRPKGIYIKHGRWYTHT